MYPLPPTATVAKHKRPNNQMHEFCINRGKYPNLKKILFIVLKLKTATYLLHYCQGYSMVYPMLCSDVTIDL